MHSKTNTHTHIHTHTHTHSFAKKVGDKIGVTNDGGSAPIVIFSLVGGLAVIGFGLYAAYGGL
jgi:hypothetical protein